MNDPKNKLGQYAGLEQLSTQALEDLLQQDFAAGEDHSNPDLVMAIMEVMEQRTPQAAPAVDVDAAWNAFRAREDSAHGTRGRGRRSSPRGRAGPAVRRPAKAPPKKSAPPRPGGGGRGLCPGLPFHPSGAGQQSAAKFGAVV